MKLRKVMPDDGGSSRRRFFTAAGDCLAISGYTSRKGYRRKHLTRIQGIVCSYRALIITNLINLSTSRRALTFRLIFRSNDFCESFCEAILYMNSKIILRQNRYILQIELKIE